MKNIIISYDSTGHLVEKYEDDKYYIAQGENNALVFSVTFPDGVSGSVRAYVEFEGGGNVIECGTVSSASGKIECSLSAEYLAYDYLKIGFEVVTPTKEIRFEPLEIYVDEFVNVSGKKKATGYTVTVKVGTVTTLPAGSEATVTNIGTDKDAVFVFGIPKGDKGDTGATGATGPQGPKGDKGDMSCEEVYENELDGLSPTETTFYKVIGSSSNTTDTDWKNYYVIATPIAQDGGNSGLTIDLRTQIKISAWDVGMVIRWQSNGRWSEWSSIAAELLKFNELEVLPDGLCVIGASHSSTAVYRLTADSDITLEPPLLIPSMDGNDFYQICIQANITSDVSISWGTSLFFNGEIPDIGIGRYDFIFEWDGIEWCVGAIEKGVIE